MKKFLLFFMLFSFASFAEESLLVRVPTESQLRPIYLSPIGNHNSQFSFDYLKELYDVMHFDLNHNGMTYTVEQKGNSLYGLDLDVSGKTLSATVFSKETQSASKMSDLQLTGDLSKDRHMMHLVADSLHHKLFGKNGIATSRVLYTVRTAVPGKKNEWRSEVWEADYDGQNAKQITNHSGYAVTPVYVPPAPGKRPGSFLYVGYKTGQPKIYIASLQDGQGKRLSYMKGNQLMPTISKQRDQIAFISDVTTNPDLFVQPYDPSEGPVGKPRQIFSARLSTQGTPSFSPDGKRIAFVSNKAGPPQIYVMPIPQPGENVKNLNPTLLTRYNRGSTAPAWSPDGTKIAYCATVDRVRQIWVYDLVKKEERQLTQGPGNKENPTWAPNSLHLIYNTSDENNSELYLINLKQAEATKISSGPGEKRFPSWMNYDL